MSFAEEASQPTGNQLAPVPGLTGEAWHHLRESWMAVCRVKDGHVSHCPANNSGTFRRDDEPWAAFLRDAALIQHLATDSLDLLPLLSFFCTGLEWWNLGVRSRKESGNQFRRNFERECSKYPRALLERFDSSGLHRRFPSTFLEFDGLTIPYDAIATIRMVAVLDWAGQFARISEKGAPWICDIGSGCGFTAGYMRRLFGHRATIVLCDLGAMLPWAMAFLMCEHPTTRFHVFDPERDSANSVRSSAAHGAVLCVCTDVFEQFLELGEPLDLAVNIGSFQEMTPNATRKIVDCLATHSVELVYSDNLPLRLAMSDKQANVQAYLVKFFEQLLPSSTTVLGVDLSRIFLGALRSNGGKQNVCRIVA